MLLQLAAVMLPQQPAGVCVPRRALRILIFGIRFGIQRSLADQRADSKREAAPVVTNSPNSVSTCARRTRLSEDSVEKSSARSQAGARSSDTARGAALVIWRCDAKASSHALHVEIELN